MRMSRPGWQRRNGPGLTKIARLEPGTKGLAAALGKLHTFYGGVEDIEHADPLFHACKLGLR